MAWVMRGCWVCVRGSSAFHKKSSMWGSELGWISSSEHCTKGPYKTTGSQGSAHK
jgi:hypothetical protein